MTMLNALDIFKNTTQPYRIVLVLQEDQAFWFKWQDHTVLESFVESVKPEPLATSSRPPWLQSEVIDAGVVIELVIDSSLEELDRIKLDTPGATWVKRLKTHRLMHCLKKQYAEASVKELPGYLSPYVLSIVHHIIPEHFDHWLRQLQMQGVRFSHVAMATELLCHCVKPQHGPVLLVHSTQQEQRHILIDRSVPLFMQMESVSDTDDATRESIARSMRYVTQELLDEQRAISLLIPRLDWPSPSAAYSAARLLSALMVGHCVDTNIQSVALSKHGLLEGLSLPRGHAQQRVAEGPVIENNTTAGSVIRLFFAKGVHSTPWRLGASRRIALAVLQPSLRKASVIARIAFLQKVTLVCAMLATATVMLASMHGIAAARERARLNGEEQHLQGQIGPLAESMQQLEVSPAFVALSIERMDQYKRSQALDPAVIMVTIAQAITEFPALYLNTLSWTTLTEESNIDAVFTTSENVSTRESLWSGESNRPRVQMEFSGTLSGAIGLRAQQQILDTFVLYLENLPGVDVVQVLESPVNTAQSSVSLADNQSAFRIFLIMSSV